MKLALQYEMQRHTLDDRLVLKETLEQCNLADQVGFDYLWFVEHHFLTGFSASPCPDLIYSALSQTTKQIRLGLGVVILPYHHPVRVAERVAMLDHLSDGRVDFGTGRSAAYEVTGMGIDPRDTREMWAESLSMVPKIWDSDFFEWEGKYWQVPRRQVLPKPYQDPHPPIWVAANHDRAIRRAARWGYPWLINPHATVPMVAGQLEEYRQALSRTGLEYPQAWPMMRELYVAEDQERAYLESQPYLEGKYAAYASWGQDNAMPGEESFSVPYKDLAKDRFLLGSPDDVVSEINRYGEELGVNYMIFRMQWPGMDQKLALRQIEIMGRDVIPRLKS